MCNARPKLSKCFRASGTVKNPSAKYKRCRFDPLVRKFPGEEMATHSRILAWKILWTEEAGELQSMGSQRVKHD